MDEPRTLKVGAVARLAGVTVRTLHHYDEIGLLRPSGRSEAGYRRYTDADLERLQRILFYRELEFGLDQIRDAIADGAADALDHLRRQHELLQQRIERLRRLSDAVAKAMEAHQMGIRLTPEERLRVFDSFDPDAYTDEVQERWGDTEAYRESARRTARYTEADWLRIKADGAAINDRFVAAMAAGLPADGEGAMDSAEAHRRYISDSFYPCPTEMHTGLAEMYLADPRFTANYERLATGLAQYVHDAIVANAARQRDG
jgi:MerR family transcriptional regulator, thiopeptide resistance regulator